MAEIRWSFEAAQWLQEIYEYIAEDSATAAGKVVDGIYNRVQILCDFPDIGHKYRAIPAVICIGNSRQFGPAAVIQKNCQAGARPA